MSQKKNCLIESTEKQIGRRKSQTKAVINGVRAVISESATPFVPTGKPRGRPKKVAAEERFQL